MCRVSDRLGNNVVDLLVSTLLMAMVGRAAAALTGYAVRRPTTPTGAGVTDTAREA